MLSWLDLKETFPGRLLSLGFATVAAIAAVVAVENAGISIILIGVGIGSVIGIAAAIFARRDRRHVTHSPKAAWALATLAVGSGVFLAGSLPRAVPAVLGFGAGFFAVLSIAAPASLFRRWSDIRAT